MKFSPLPQADQEKYMASVTTSSTLSLLMQWLKKFISSPRQASLLFFGIALVFAISHYSAFPIAQAAFEIAWTFLFYTVLYLFLDQLFSLESPSRQFLLFLFLGAVSLELFCLSPFSTYIGIFAFAGALAYRIVLLPQEQRDESQSKETSQTPTTDVSEVAREDAILPLHVQDTSQPVPEIQPAERQQACSPLNTDDEKAEKHLQQQTMLIAALEKERNELKGLLYAAREELATAYLQLRDHSAMPVELEDKSQILPVVQESYTAATCKDTEGVQLVESATTHDVQEQSYEAKYMQLRQQFQELRHMLDETRKELFIVQGREMALSRKLQEYDISSTYASLYELSRAFSSTKYNEVGHGKEESEHLHSLIHSYEEMIAILMHRMEELEHSRK